MIKRLIGPFLMIACGVALLAGPAQAPALDVGTISTSSTTTTTDPCAPQVGVVNPCTTTTTEAPITVPPTTDPCGPTQGVVIVDPCTTTTTEPVATTVVDGPTTSEPPLGTGVEQTTTSVDPGAVSGDGSNQGGTGDGSLPRTGSNDLPLTVAGISLIVLGAGLAVAARRQVLSAQR